MSRNKKIGVALKVVASVLVVALVIVGGVYLFKNRPVYEKTLDMGWCVDNNGADVNSDEVNRLIAVRPTEIQATFNDLEYYSFIHYGMNTFTGLQWGTGKETPLQYDPKKPVDTDQWVRVLKESGSTAVIFTAKHHDGFCLWPTEYTDHSIKYSPYQDGKGDICQQIRESCDKYDMKLGFYLSPWDMHEKTYGTPEYDDFFVKQLTELCTNYGEIACFWFDGAGPEENPQKYDFERYFDVIRKLQPKSAIANVGPDVRWIGNEAGVVRDSEWSVITSGDASIEAIMGQSQKTSDDAKRLQSVGYDASDRGSRDLVKDYRDLVWYPAEADVSIHHDWFYNKKKVRPRSVNELEKIYFNSVGGNALLLLNIPPNEDGVIAEDDVKTLKEWKGRIDKVFEKPLESTNSVVNVDGAEKALAPFSPDTSRELSLEEKENSISMKLNSSQKVKTIVLQEDIRQSQRIEQFKVYAKTDKGYRLLHTGTIVGHKRIVRLPSRNQVETDELRIVFTQSRSNPFIRNIELYG